MCGRFTLKTPPDQWGQLLLPLEDRHGALQQWRPRYNIAPTQNILCVVASPGGELDYQYLRWGLVPPWADDLAIGNRMINARAETLLEKRSFRGPMRSRRCLVIADGYYEWKREADGKQPYWIAPGGGGAIQFAGLWEINRKAAEEPILSCAIITTDANEELKEIHDRMPAILRRDEAERWANLDFPADRAQRLLQPAPRNWLVAHKANRIVGNPRYDGPECLQPPD
ncbi:MAG: SOS response-associated peptidase [Planctomycetota bacterium]|nr:MAG: SOS response-associated peptidase [Planctomycetota bacterium]